MHPFQHLVVSSFVACSLAVSGEAASQGGAAAGKFYLAVDGTAGARTYNGYRRYHASLQSLSRAGWHRFDVWSVSRRHIARCRIVPAHRTLRPKHRNVRHEGLARRTEPPSARSAPASWRCAGTWA
jgi:hypothetical protein